MAKSERPVTRRWVRRSVAIGVLIGLLGGAAPAAATEPTSDLRSTFEYADATRFRTEFFLDARATTIEQSLTDRARFPDMDTFGVPLTHAEVAELERRGDVQQKLHAATAWATEEASDAYGGVWIDHSRGGLPVFMIKRGGDAARAGVISRIEAGIEHEVREVDRSWVELERLQEQINEAWLTGELEGIPVVSTGIGTATNTVLVGLEPVHPEYEEALRKRFGDGLSFRMDRSDTVADTNNCQSDCAPPRVGGIGMKHKDLNRSCTTGFIVKVTTGTDYFGMITAGHCVVTAPGDHGVGDTWRHPKSDGTIITIGTVVGDTWYNGDDADVALLRAVNPPADRNNIVISDLEYRNITDIATNGEQNVGFSICRFARTTGKVCGQIAVPNVTRDSTNPGIATKSIDHQWEVTFDADGGDSGGPYFYGQTAYGIHTDSDPGFKAGQRGWYSTLNWARSAYTQRHGVTWSYCITNGC